MKVRKEYLIFGCIVLVLIVIIIVTTFSGKNKGYEQAKKYISYEEIEREPLIEEDYSDNDTEETLVSDNSTESIQQSEEPTESIEEPTEEIMGETTEEQLSEEVDEDVLKSDSISDDYVGNLDNDTVITLVRYYVCNLNSDSFSKYLTQDLINIRTEKMKEEPFLTLSGKTSIESTEVLENIVKLGIEGVVYSFKVSYNEDGTMITDIEFVE